MNVQPGPAFTDDDYATQGIDPNGQKYSWFHRSCGDYQMGSTSGLTFAPVTGVPGAPPQIVDPRAMAETAASHVRLPELVPAVGSGNPATPSIVHIPVWLWLRSGATEPTPESEPAPGMVVTVHASVSGPVVWDMGDGHRETCTGPGTPWSPSQRDVHATNCSHSYDVDSSGQPGGSYAGTVSVTWTYRWSINGNDQGQLGGPVTRTAAFSVRVDEIQVVNV